MKTLYQVLGIISLWTAFVAGICPSDTVLTPCTCAEIKDGISIQCRGPEDTERIKSVIQNLRVSQNWELALESVTLPFLPSSVKNANSLRFFDVRIEKNQNSSSFTWSKLDDVVIESSIILDNPWSYFKEAQSLRHLKISNVEIPSIGLEFKQGVPAAVEYLEIRNTGTNSLESHGMSHLEKLKFLIMVDLPLSVFSRDVLPPTMPDLRTFILGNTEIEELERGFFEGMPKLEDLILNGNKLTTLDSLLFAPLENHLSHLVAERNPLVCDCSLLWLTKKAQKKESMNVLATCKDDATQTWLEVISLDENEYC